jgi:hypothetical protein
VRTVPLLSLFHCDTHEGNRCYEDDFQWLVFFRDAQNDLRRIERFDLTQTITQAQDEPSNTSPAVLDLANMLATSLGQKAYDKYVEDVGVAIRAIFFNEFVAAPDGGVDFEQTKAIHYQRYCLFKFASFLDLLRPDQINWRGQPESESMRLAQTGLDYFQGADVQQTVAILARWIQRPGPWAFTAKQDIRGRRIRERRVLLLKLEKLPAREVAERLDEEGIKPGRGYSSYMERYQKNPNSFQAWLSKERSEARKLPTRGSRQH